MCIGKDDRCRNDPNTSDCAVHAGSHENHSLLIVTTADAKVLIGLQRGSGNRLHSHLHLCIQSVLDWVGKRVPTVIQCDVHHSDGHNRCVFALKNQTALS